VNNEDSERLARIETKLDQALTTQKDHEDRLRGLEKSKHWLAGVYAGGSAVLTAVVSYFLKN
jgi:hypothetical protein